MARGLRVMRAIQEARYGLVDGNTAREPVPVGMVEAALDRIKEAFTGIKIKPGTRQYFYCIVCGRFMPIASGFTSSINIGGWLCLDHREKDHE